jgi:hypothetical protein
MELFFLLAGFLLASTSTRSIADKASFYKSRIVAAHPMYLLAVLVALIPLLATCPPGGGGLGTLEECTISWLGNIASGWGLTFMLLFMVFAQLAWPWHLLFGVLGLSNLASLYQVTFNVSAPLWFSSAYYFCIILFPFLHNWVTKWEMFTVREAEFMRCNIMRCFLIVMLGLIAVPNVVLAITDDNVSAYTFPPMWAGIFFLGILMWQVYEANRSRDESKVWPHWGKMVDATSVVSIAILVLISCMPSFDSAAIMGALWARPFRLSLPLWCIWIYGLATGQGYTARLLGSEVLVRYLSPASYCIYLFHWSIANSWKMIFHRGAAGFSLGFKTPSQQISSPVALVSSLRTDAFFPEITWWEWPLYAAFVTLFAMFMTHVVNPPLTATFMRCLDACLGSCACGGHNLDERGQDISIVVTESIRNLTGNDDVHSATRIDNCGLDSFGAGALIGVLHARLPKVHLNAIQVYQLETIGGLVAEIKRQVEAACMDLENQTDMS